jgi:hypothetical protein
MGPTINTISYHVSNASSIEFNDIIEFCVISSDQLEDARKSFGTDEDVIFIPTSHLNSSPRT